AASNSSSTAFTGRNRRESVRRPSVMPPAPANRSSVRIGRARTDDGRPRSDADNGNGDTAAKDSRPRPRRGNGAPADELTEPVARAAAKRMSRQRRRDTDPKLLLRRERHARGLRYRVDAPLPGMPRRRADVLL